MMIQGSMSAGIASSLFQQSTKISDEQAEKLTDFLSNYDTNDLSDDDAKDIVSQIKELGISPSSDLTSALGDAGINAKDLAEQAGIGGASGPGGSGGPGGPGGADRPPPPPPPPQETQGISSVDESIVTLIADAVETYADSDEEDGSSWNAVSSALEEAGYDTSVSLIDFYS